MSGCQCINLARAGGKGSNLILSKKLGFGSFSLQSRKRWKSSPDSCGFVDVASQNP